jgi:hypothetical protein
VILEDGCTVLQETQLSVGTEYDKSHKASTFSFHSTR